jgi:hypothetical protein
MPLTADSPHYLDDDARAAVRSYLQRAEVRLSTMHRIAGVFLNGAGLLFLFPVLLKDAVLPIISLVGLQSIILTLPLFAVLGLPLFSFYLLIRDLVHFYFTANHAGLPDIYFHPRFILSGIAFSHDEDPVAKERIEDQHLDNDMQQFLMPIGGADRKHFAGVLSSTNNEIVSQYRERVLGRAENAKERHDLRVLYTAFRLAGMVDRSLVEEAAKMELSLVRHAIHLRHLLLRYVKALLLFILTTLVLVLLNQIGQSTETARSGVREISLAVGFMVWAFWTPIVVRWPVSWIYRLASPDLEQIRDSQLVRFEAFAIAVSIITFFVSGSIGVLFLRNILSDFGHTIDTGLLLLIGAVPGLLFGVFWYYRFAVREAQRMNVRPEVESEEDVVASDRDAVDPTEQAFGTPGGPQPANPLLVSLRDILVRHYSEDELRELCFALGDVDYESLAGIGKARKASELVQYYQRRGMIPRLLARVAQDRPDAMQ